VEDLKRMKDMWFILFQTHGVVENGHGCFMHFYVAYTKRIVPKWLTSWGAVLLDIVDISSLGWFHDV
jgi:hypothetical protein